MGLFAYQSGALMPKRPEWYQLRIEPVFRVALCQRVLAPLRISQRIAITALYSVAQGYFCDTHMQEAPVCNIDLEVEEMPVAA